MCSSYVLCLLLFLRELFVLFLLVFYTGYHNVSFIFVTSIIQFLPPFKALLQNPFKILKSLDVFMFVFMHSFRSEVKLFEHALQILPIKILKPLALKQAFINPRVAKNSSQCFSLIL